MVRIPINPRRVAGLALLILACGHPTDGGGHTLSVLSTFPVGGASRININAVISATLSAPVDPASVSGATLTLSGGVTGTVSVSGSTVSFTPSAPLASATSYTATLAGSVRDAGGATLGDAYQWSFTTEPRLIPPFTLPLQAGKRWHYARNDTTTIVAASTGVTQIRFTGERFAWVAEQLIWHSAAASRLVLYDYNGTPSSGDPEFTVEEIYLAQGASGLLKWVALSGGGEWRVVVSTQSSYNGNGTFVFSQGPTQGRDLQFSTGSVTVPAGTFGSVLAAHSAHQHDQYATANWDEDRVEAFADGVGLVRSRWDYFYDDKDPQAADISQHGSIVLLDAQNTSPDFRIESEPNDTAPGATAPALPRFVVEGTTKITDVGSTMNDAAVQCPVAECVHPNKNGQPLLQDWYRVTVSATTNVKIELAYQYYDFGVSRYNDLDLYAFQAVSGGGLKYIGASTDVAGKPEALTGSLAPGTYYFAVQAWDTPGSAVRYWLSFR